MKFAVKLDFVFLPLERASLEKMASGMRVFGLISRTVGDLTIIYIKTVINDGMNSVRQSVLTTGWSKRIETKRRVSDASNEYRLPHQREERVSKNFKLSFVKRLALGLLIGFWKKMVGNQTHLIGPLHNCP